jgi:DNA-binding MarR family transcriptional regulator
MTAWSAALFRGRLTFGNYVVVNRIPDRHINTQWTVGFYFFRGKVLPRAFISTGCYFYTGRKLGSMGRPPSLSNTDVLKIVALHHEPVVASKDIHEKMDMTQRGANKRLQKLADEGFLGQKQVGSSAMVFWLTDAGRKELNEVF